MPIDYSNYPKNWKNIRNEILQRAENRCECVGECGKDHFDDSIVDSLHKKEWHVSRCMEKHMRKPRTFGGMRVILTIAHLNHKPMDVRRKNLKAMCQACHLRYDKDQHARSRRRGMGLTI